MWGPGEGPLAHPAGSWQPFYLLPPAPTQQALLKACVGLSGVLPAEKQSTRH